MKAALIPPHSGLDRFGGGDFHLLLSHLLVESKVYAMHYRAMRKMGAYLVLDNSAHEKGYGNDPMELMAQAIWLDAQEVVVPDVLDNAEKTVEAAISAHEAWFERGKVTEANDKALMYVPQGATREEWRECLTDLTRIHCFTSVFRGARTNFVLGVSKDYEKWDGGLMRLIDEDVKPKRDALLQEGIKMQVHLLGWGRDLWALEEIAKKHPWIRSTDSAKPFVYALHGIALDPTDPPPPYPRRPKNYFKKRMNEEQESQAVLNSMIFRALASGSLTNAVKV